MADVLLRRNKGTSIVLVISSLEDQVNYLNSLNISAISVTDEHNDRTVVDIIMANTLMYMVLQNAFYQQHGKDCSAVRNLSWHWYVLLLMKLTVLVNGKCNVSLYIASSLYLT